MELHIWEILLRIALAVAAGGIIGINREHSNRPAGIRTHIIVCVGATVFALVQVAIMVQTLQLAEKMPDVAGVIRSDPARLIAQVISGIGFLGAGTIILTKRVVLGLTTAASLWAMAGIGLSFGMGYYAVGLIGLLAVFVVLKMPKALMGIPETRWVRISYSNEEFGAIFLPEYLKKANIYVRDKGTNVGRTESGGLVYKDTILLEFPKGMVAESIVHDIIKQQDVLSVDIDVS